VREKERKKRGKEDFGQMRFVKDMNLWENHDCIYMDITSSILLGKKSSCTREYRRGLPSEGAESLIRLLRRAKPNRFATSLCGGFKSQSL
jgi:hypothetical protein